MAEPTPKTFELPAELTEQFRAADVAFVDFCEKQGLAPMDAAINLVRYHRHLAATITSGVIKMAEALEADDDTDDEAVEGAPV